MSMEAKTRLINQIKTELTEIVTVAAMDKILEVLANKMAFYEIEVKDVQNIEQDDMLTAYLDAKAVEGRTEKTIERYRYEITKMLKGVNLPTREIGVFDIRGFLSREKSRGISDGTLDGDRQVYNGYFGWLQREGLIKINPMGNIAAIKKQKKVKDVYTDIDIERLKNNCTNARNRAIISVLLATGCRISEVTGLNRENVDLTSLECKVLGKGNKERIVYLDEVAAMNLREYLDERTDDDPALFMSARHARLKPGGVRIMLKKLQIESNVNHVHPHKFRRTLATNMIRRGMPIEEVAAILGHEKLDTTMQYIVLDKSDVKHAYRKYA